MASRRQRSRQIREAAAEIAAARPHPEQTPNEEEYRYRFDEGHAFAGQPSYLARFTKGLPHDEDGFLVDPRDYDDFSEAIESGSYEEFRAVRIGPRDVNDRDADGEPIPLATPPWAGDPAQIAGVRKWESPTAGHIFDLEGPDAQATSMPEAPPLDSDELVAEMAEVYGMALLRDVPFSEFESSPEAAEVLDCLRQLPWFGYQDLGKLSPEEECRRRSLDAAKPRDLFRGLTAGDLAGPFVSQFLLLGTGPRGEQTGTTSLESGKLDYGAVRIDMRVREATPKLDYLTRWSDFLDVQNGANPIPPANAFAGSGPTASYKHIETPRDLATYVHFDQLYEAYLNAALFLFELGAPLDRGLPLIDEPTQTGFASFGGPHLLALLTEVSSRALKAVRYQKFNVHRRLRPEAVGGLLDAYDRGAATANLPHGLGVMERLHAALDDCGMLERVRTHNAAQNEGKDLLRSQDRAGSVLLPMAFAEGSPMHPAYGAGHATVAGACTTILKAWFDCDFPLGFAYETQGGALVDRGDEGLTVGGELDKLAANISNARNMAGVHYYTDYWESLLLGERIALGILEEQRLTYPESFRLTIPRFRPAKSAAGGGYKLPVAKAKGSPKQVTLKSLQGHQRCATRAYGART